MSDTSTMTPPEARTHVRHPYLCLMGLYLGGFAGMYSETALNIALPQLSAAFDVDLALAQWLVVGYMLVIGIVLPFTSLLSKWFSLRRITLFALGAFLVGSLISGCAPTFAIALSGRAIQGIGTGLVLPLMFSMVLEVIPPHRIGAAMGINALVIMAASAVGPTIAGLLIGVLSWRAIFFSFALVLAIGIVFAARFLVNPYKLTRPHVDVPSVLTSLLGFGGIVLGAGIASLYGWGSVPTITALVVGALSLVVYARRQLNMDDPIIDLRVFKMGGFRVGALCVMINFGITLSVMYVLPQFYQNSLLLAVSVAGLVMLPGGIVNAIVSAVAGTVYDRIGARIPALVGFGLSILGAALLLLATPETPLAYVVVCHIILMVGIPLAMSPCQTHALASLPPELSTDGSTMLNTMQQVLGAICTAMATYLLSVGQSTYVASGGATGAAAFAQGSHLVFLFALVLAALAFALSTRIKRGGVDADGEKDASGSPQGSHAQAHGAGELAPFMETPVFALQEGSTALDALKLFADKGISGAPVLDEGGMLVGFVSDGDVIGTLSRLYPTFTSIYAYATDADGESFEERVGLLAKMTVGEIATHNVLSVSVDDDIRDVCTLLSSRHLKKVPVMDGERMVGVINRSNITRRSVELLSS